MKKVLFSAVLLMVTSATIFAQDAAKKISDIAKFDSDTIRLGNIKQCNPTKGTFTVTNISTSPIIIEQANPTCGCTISDYTKSPIPAGQNGVINATYNAAGIGHFEKHLTVKLAGINEMKTITLKGEVLVAADYDKWKADADAKAAADAAAAAAAAPKKGKKEKENNNYYYHYNKRGSSRTVINNFKNKKCCDNYCNTFFIASALSKHSLYSSSALL